jgi:hypothetical protein
MPSLAEADTVMASEASSAAVIKTKRLIWFSPVASSRSGTSSRRMGLFPGAQTKSFVRYPGIGCRLFPPVRWRCSPRRRQRDAESVRRVARDGVGDATWRLRPSPLSRFTPAACGRRPGLRRFRRSQRESVSRRGGLRRRGLWRIGGHRARRHDGRQAGVDHDPLRPSVARLNADAAVNIGPGRLERELRHVPVRHEQQRQQCAAYKDEIPTEGHAHHRCFDPQKPASTENNPQWFRRKWHGQKYGGLRPCAEIGEKWQHAS